MSPLAEVEIWFYVPDYVTVSSQLKAAYKKYDVDEWAAESGRVGGCPDDADVTVRGTDQNVAKFWNWLVDSNIPGLMLEGRDVKCARCGRPRGKDESCGYCCGSPGCEVCS